MSELLSITKMTFSLKSLIGLHYCPPILLNPLENRKHGHHGSNPSKPSSTSACRHNVLHTMQVDVAGCICSSIWHVFVANQSSPTESYRTDPRINWAKIVCARAIINLRDCNWWSRANPSNWWSLYSWIGWCRMETAMSWRILMRIPRRMSLLQTTTQLTTKVYY